MLSGVLPRAEGTRGGVTLPRGLVGQCPHLNCWALCFDIGPPWPKGLTHLESERLGSLATSVGLGQ